MKTAKDTLNLPRYFRFPLPRYFRPKVTGGKQNSNLKERVSYGLKSNRG